MTGIIENYRSVTTSIFGLKCIETSNGQTSTIIRDVYIENYVLTGEFSTIIDVSSVTGLNMQNVTFSQVSGPGIPLKIDKSEGSITEIQAFNVTLDKNKVLDVLSSTLTASKLTFADLYSNVSQTINIIPICISVELSQ